MATKKSKAQVIDEETGEVRIVRSQKKSYAPPSIKTVTPINQVAGPNPMAVNLRDHEEFNGMTVTFMDVKFRDSTIDGKKNTYMIGACYITPAGVQPTEENFVVLMTGSENIVGRIADVIALADETGGDPFPVSGTLRKAGRAWFLD